jgi:hypothetical protein
MGFSPLFDIGHRAGIGTAIRILRENGYGPEVQDCLQEWIDEYEIALGNTKREPRSNKYKSKIIPTTNT